jgi:hypothetical protein
MKRITYLAAAVALVATSGFGVRAADGATAGTAAAHVRTTDRQGTDDPAGHDRHHGADDRAGHHRHGADDPAGHDRQGTEPGDDNGHGTEPGDDNGDHGRHHRHGHDG